MRLSKGESVKIELNMDAILMPGWLTSTLISELYAQVIALYINTREQN
jgi:hypothetical protein